MADPYIDQLETLSYGTFAVRGIRSIVMGLDPELDGALDVMAKRVEKSTKAMEKVLQRAGELKATTFASAATTADDPVGQAKKVLGQLVSYVSSRDDGITILEEVLGGETLTAIKRRRPGKLIGALDTAMRAVGKHKASLPEHAEWAAKLKAAREQLSSFDEVVRTSKHERRHMTPEVSAARDRWLIVYGAAKLLVEAVLKLHGKVDRLPDVFDDLAEVHRAPGVKDDTIKDDTAKAPKPT